MVDRHTKIALQMTRIRRSPVRLAALAVVGLCLVAVPFALAAAPLAYTTPAAIAKKITGNIPHIQTGNAAVPSVITATICTGLPPAHAGGTFNTFRCKATYLNGQKKANVWARALPGGKFCAASTGLTACPAAPATVGDPRICTLTGAPPTADPNYCALGSAILALERAESVTFQTTSFSPLNLSCTGQNLRWTCVFSTSADRTVHHAAVVFAQATTGAWSASVSGCTVLPGAPSGGERWRTGPTPVCG